MTLDVTNTTACRFCRAPIGQPCRTRTLDRLFGRRPGRFVHVERINDANTRTRFLLNHPDHRGLLATGEPEVELSPTDTWMEHAGLGYDEPAPAPRPAAYALDVQCLLCGAKPGWPCTGAPDSGRAGMQVPAHQVRRDSARSDEQVAS